jgi:hypothetical protein
MKKKFISDFRFQKSVLFISLVAGVFACSSSSQYQSQLPPNSSPTPVPGTPSPTPTPEKKKLLRWRCKILNGEGRVFEAIDDNSETAESRARSQCETSYRHCTFLDCSTFISE